MLKLKLSLPDGTRQVHSFFQGPVLIGRSPEATLFVNEPSLSRRHALFHLGEEGWFVEDLDSRNGTFLDGARLTGRALLRAGQTLTMGQLRLVVEECGAPAEVAETQPGETTLLAPVAKVLEDSGVSSAVLSLDAPPEALKRYAARLSLLAQVHERLATQVSEEGLLAMVLDQVFQQLAPDQAAIFLRQDDGAFVCVASRCQQDCYDKLLLSRSLVREVVEKKAAALVLDAFTDARFQQAMSLRSLGVRSILAVPLLSEDEALGLLVCASRLAVRRFGQEDLEFVVPLAAVAAMRLRNLRLAAEAAKRRQLEEELDLARRIQVGLFREQAPQLAGYETLGGNLPSRVVSGDFYQLLPSPGDLTALVADVAGKGIGAAILAASLEALFAGPLSLALGPGETLAKVSELFFARTDPVKFATAVLLSLDAASGTVRYANAGHCPPLLLRSDGTSQAIPSTGPPLGMFPGQAYRQGEVTLRPGDLLALYSDGVTETTNPQGEEFGTERLAALLASHRQRPPSELWELVEAELDRFAESSVPADDRTLVLLRRR